MQLQAAKTGAVLQGGIEESIGFTIEADGKMFQLLSDTLYENKIGSLVREVSCNAMDSHTAAGKPDEPFCIHTPTSYEPWFSVIDYGVGLSHEEVTKIYTRFGKSTKTDSNEQVGAFGFGSKTPFAYTSAFTVIAIKDGKRNSYAAVVDDEGMPKMSLLGSEDTTEPNGVEVQVPVETWDFQEFYDEIRKQLRYFKVKPTIKGAPITFDNPMESVFESVGEHTHFRRSGGVEVVQGGVAYRVDIEALVKNVKDRPQLVNFIRSAVNRYCPIMFFPIGAITVTASREGIAYKPQTVNNIMDRLQEVYDVLVRRIDEKMVAAPTKWEKARTLASQRDLFSSFINFRENNWGVWCDHANVPHLVFPDGMYEEIDAGNHKIRHRVEHIHLKFGRTGRTSLDVQSYQPERVQPTDNIMFIIDDGADFGPGRIRRYMGENRYRITKVYFLTAEKAEVSFRGTRKHDDGTEVEHVMYANWTKGEVLGDKLTALLEAMDGAPIKMLSDLPKEERITVVRNPDGSTAVREKYIPAKTYLFEGFNHDDSFSTFKNYSKAFVAAKKVDEDVAYVLVDRRKVTLGLDHADMRFLHVAYRNDLFPMPIHAVREKDLDRVAKNPRWKPLKDVVNKLREEYKEKYKIAHIRAGLAYSGDNLINIIGMKVSAMLAERRDELEDRLLRGHLARKARRTRRKATKPVDAMCEFLYENSVAEIVSRTQAKDERRSETMQKRYNNAGGLFNRNHDWTDADIDMVIAWLNIQYEKSLAKK